ncbi:MAG TPA: lipopolysaccharide biosynthesis protein [Terriglobales bacterium]|nr:lipopolysaccharide biosynthesis protein [Terriglobales bacterium]
MRPFTDTGSFHLDTDHDKLPQVALRSAGLTVVSQGVILAVQMFATFTLARLLTPHDFGLVTIVTTFTGLLGSFGLNGITEAVLQREKINRFLASNLFWINLAQGLVLTLVLAASGSLIAHWFREPLVAQAVFAMAPTILVSSTSVLHLALLKRAMRFSAISINDICARVLSVFVSIVLGLLGWGYWALVVGVIAQAVSTSIGAWAMCQWIPSFPRRAKGTAAMVRFSLSVYGHFITSYGARNVDNVLVGLRFGTISLGFYKKAYDLFVLPTNQLLSPMSAVVIGMLSRLSREQQQYKRHFLTGLSVLSFVAMAVSADLTLVGKDVIRVVLGPNWEATGGIFTLFGPAIGVMLLYNTHSALHLSLGKPDRWFRWGLIEFGTTVLFFILALPWGPEGIAVAWSASYAVLIIPAFWYAGRPIHLGLGPILAVTWKYILASVLSGITSAAIVRELHVLEGMPGILGAEVRIVTTSSVFLVVYLSVVRIGCGREPFTQLTRLFGLLGWKEKFSKSFTVFQSAS